MTKPTQLKQQMRLKIKLQQEVDRLVNKYPHSLPDSRDLFRVELEYLVLLAEILQMAEDHKATMALLKGSS